MNLIGRRDEQDQLARLVDQGAGSVVAVTGRAGVGKSALLRTLAHRLPERAQLWSVDLTGAREGADALEEVARTLGVSSGVARGSGANLPAAPQQLARVFGSGRAVLAVDHLDGYRFEEGHAGRLLSDCPALTIVVARATRCGDDQREIALRPLEVPTPGARLAEIAINPSVQLFVERATKADAGFVLDEETAAPVAELCRLLGGLPLAIELAAARSRLMPLSRLVATIRDGESVALDLLAARQASPDASLRTTLSSTFDTLGDIDRELLEMLADFAGPVPSSVPVTLSNHPAGDVIDGLERLVDLRLLNATGGAKDDITVSLLPIVRAFVRERSPHPELRERRRRFLEKTLTSAAATVADARTGPDVDLAVALRRDLAQECGRLAEDDVARATAWSVACAEVLQGHAETAAAAEVLARVLADGAGETLPPLVHARALLWGSSLLAFSPDGAGMRDLVIERWRRGMDLLGDHCPPTTRLTGLLIGVINGVTTGEVAVAAQCAAEGRELALRLGQATWAARFRLWSAAAANTLGQVARAVELALSALEHGLRVHDAQTVVGATLVLRTVPADTVPADAPVPTFMEALALARSVRDVLGEWLLLAALTRLELDRGRPRSAARWCAERLAAAQQRGLSYLVSMSLVHAVLIAVELDAPAFAARILGAVHADRARVLRSMAPATTRDLERARTSLESQLGTPRLRESLRAGGMVSMVDAVTQARLWLEEQQEAQPQSMPQAHLTPREREVLALLAEGLTNKEIAARLHVSPKTVMHHSVSIYRKLEVRGRAEATAFAFRHGLVAGSFASQEHPRGH